MEIKTKDVTKDYQSALRKKTVFVAVFNLLSGLLLLIVCFFPIAYVGEYSIGTGYNIIISFIKNISATEKTSVVYLTYFLYLSVFCVVFGGYFIYDGLKKIAIRDKYDIGENILEFAGQSHLYIREEDEYFTCSFGFVVKKLLLLLLFLACSYLLIWANDLVITRYKFIFKGNWVIFCLAGLLWVKSFYCNLITLKYEEKGLFTNNLAELEKKFTKEEKKAIKKVNGWILFVWIFLSVIIVVGLAALNYISRFSGYCNFGHNSVAGWVISPDDSNLLRFDEKCLKQGGMGRVVGIKGFGDYIIEIEEDESNTKDFTFYGDAYRYYTLKIEELTEERNSLFPEEDSEEALKEYFNTIEAMTKSIEYMKNQMYGHSFSYEYVAFEEGYLTDIVYDACPKNTEKWNMEADFFSSIFFKQKITLTDRYCKNEKTMDKFAVGTDFSTELIVARIQYSDGSVKITKVKPTNVDELNNAKAGEHVLKWADNWGEYEVTITLY